VNGVQAPGEKDSAFGDVNQYGEDSIRFFTRTKVVTQRWPRGGSATDQSFVLPT
jgi:malonate-semialdehyde dehydrogenase (acetylating)/methylmalonate-semialdehyde dehydrogenase